MIADLKYFDSNKRACGVEGVVLLVADALQIELANRVGHREGVVERVSFGN